MDEKKAPVPSEGDGGCKPDLASGARTGEARGVLYVYVPGKRYPVPAGAWVRPSRPAGAWSGRLGVRALTCWSGRSWSLLEVGDPHDDESAAEHTSLA